MPNGVFSESSDEKDAPLTKLKELATQLDAAQASGKAVGAELAKAKRTRLRLEKTRKRDAARKRRAGKR